MPKENRYRCINKVGSDPCLYAKERRVILETEAIPGLGGFCCPGKTDSGRDCRELLRKISEPVNGGSGGGEGKTVLDTIMEFLRSPIGLASIVVALLIIGGLLAWWRWGGGGGHPPECGKPGQPACHQQFHDAIKSILDGAGNK